MVVLSLQETIDSIILIEQTNSLRRNKHLIESVIVRYDQLEQIFPMGRFRTIHGLLHQMISFNPPFYNSFFETNHFLKLVDILGKAHLTSEFVPVLIYEATFKSKYHGNVNRDDLLRRIHELKNHDNQYWAFVYPPIPDKDAVLTECQLEYWKVALEKLPKGIRWDFVYKTKDEVHKDYIFDSNALKYNWLCKPKVQSHTKVYLDKGNKYKIACSPYQDYIENQTILHMICENVESHVAQAMEKPALRVNHNMALLLKHCTRCPDYSNKSDAERLVLEVAHGKFDSFRKVLKDLRIVRDWPAGIKCFIMDSFRFGLGRVEFQDAGFFSHKWESTKFTEKVDGQSDVVDQDWEEFKGILTDSLKSSTFNLNRFVEFLIKDPKHFRPRVLTALLKSENASHVYLSFIRKNDNIIKEYLFTANEQAYERVVDNTNIRRVQQLLSKEFPKRENWHDIGNRIGKPRALDLLRRGALLFLPADNAFFKVDPDDSDLDRVMKALCRKEIPDLTALSYEMFTVQLPIIAKQFLFNILENQLKLHAHAQKVSHDDLKYGATFDWNSVPLDDLMEGDELRRYALRFLFSKIKRLADGSTRFFDDYYLFTLLASVEIARFHITSIKATSE